MDSQKIEELLKVDLAEALGFSEKDLENPKVLDTFNQIEFIILRGVWIKIYELLEENKQQELSYILENTPDDGKGLVEFLKKELPDYENIIKTEIANYKERFIAKAKEEGK